MWKSRLKHPSSWGKLVYLWILLFGFGKLTGCVIFCGSCGSQSEPIGVLGRRPWYEHEVTGPISEYMPTQYIPAGQFVPIDSEECTFQGRDTLPVRAYYISKTEVTNYQYAQFLWALKDSADTVSLQTAMYDSLQWYHRLCINYPLDCYTCEYYHFHPAYDAYPTVNISIAGAELYCSWLEEQLIQRLREDRRHIHGLEVRLPYRHEWTYAALAHHENERTYSLGSNALKDLTDREERKKLNEIAWSKIRRKDSIELYSYAIRKTRPVVREGDTVCYDFSGPGPQQSKAFRENDFGLIHMSGNVREIVINELPPGNYLPEERSLRLTYCRPPLGRNISPPEYTTMGGSWADTKEFLDIRRSIPYEGPDPYTGFRVVITYDSLSYDSDL